MKWNAKTFVFLIITILTVFSCAGNACASGSGAAEYIIIPPEGSLFMPDSMATRGTVGAALYNMADNKNINDVGTNSAQNDESSKTAPVILQKFSDVPKDSPYYMSANFCSSKGYISGYPDGTFRPEGYITRAEICVVLVRFFSLNTDIKIALPTDVATGHWASDSIAACISSGVMSGYEDKAFKPDKRLTRAELAVIIVSVKHLTQPENIIDFNDVPKTHWAYKYIACVSAPSFPELSPYESDVVRMINEERTKAGAGALVLDPFLCEMARMKAQDMADNGYFGHKSPKWGYPDEMMRAFGVTFNYYGENIACGDVIPADVVDNWVCSSPHLDNIVSKNYKRTGVGCAKGKNGALYWVQDFSD